MTAGGAQTPGEIKIRLNPCGGGASWVCLCVDESAIRDNDNGLAAIDTEGHCGASEERLIVIFPEGNWECCMSDWNPGSESPFVPLRYLRGSRP